MCHEMQPPNQHQRINLAKLKGQIVKKLGPEESKQYFYCLNRFLSLKLSRVEFNKLCIGIVGRENISLHNQFVRSILKNACSSKVPPLTYDKEVPKSVGNKEPPSNGHKPSVPNLSSGYILPSSPRKARIGTRDRKVSNCSSARGPNGKINFVSHESSSDQDSKSNVSLENGDLTQIIERPVQHHKGCREQASNEGEVVSHLSIAKKVPDGSVHTNNRIETVVFENRKEVCAPLGVPSCPVSVGGARKRIPLASSSNRASSFNSGSLLDTATLRERMGQIAAAQGLEGVPMDCANLLNNGLDSYLRGLILSCIELVGARSGNETTERGTHKHPKHSKLVNGFRPKYHIQSGNRPMEIVKERRPHCTTSLLDFRVAMELNPQQLGEDWPLLLEKIRTQSFEE